MKNNKITQKNNIIFFILLFLIPVLAIDASFYFLSDINFNWDKKEQERNAVLEAEILASESDFGNQLSSLFKKYCDVIRTDAQLTFGKEHFLTSHLEQSANAIFANPFPAYSLHVFKIASSSQSSEMIFAHGDTKGGKRGLCLAFDHIYNLAANIKVDPVKAKSNETFAKNLVGQYSDIESIAREMRGMPTYINFHNTSNWFIWDYMVIPEKGVFGAILICDEVKNFESIGRLLALKSQRARGRAIGAFIPLYTKLGGPIYQTPLENSEIFLNWAKSISVEKEIEYDKWLKNDLPQGVKLGNYTAFCYLERGSSHIAVILVKSVKEFIWPKWLKALNLLLLLSMVAIVFFGLCYESWPPISLKTRFVLSYVLASVLPLCLLSVTAYGYIQQYKNTTINKAVSDLESTLKSFDALKAANVNEYKSAFTKSLTDPRLISLIKEKGIESELVAQRVVDIFENDENIKPLPILGVKIYDENGIGAFVKGGVFTSQNVDLLFNSCLSANIMTLRNRIITDEPEAEARMKKLDYSADGGNLGALAYFALAGNEIGTAMNKHSSVPILRKNGDFAYYQIFDFIKIDGKVKYLLFVIWDDKTLDNRILQNAFDTYALKNLKQSFVGLRIKGQNVEYVGEKTRHATQKTFDKAIELAKLVAVNKQISTFVDDEKLIVAMPSSNFTQTVFVGWISMSDVVGGILERQFYLILLLIVSLIIVCICSLRSVGVFLFPATELTKALDTVSNGNLNIDLKSDSNDEFGRLSKEFSGMIDGLRERERLSKLISDQAVQALEKHSDGLLNDTETFEGVALVSDIRNFTGISEANDPMVITDLLNEHFAEMTKVISDNGGLIYKFIGDAIEAVFPEKKELKESASERAFRAGCMMIAALATINSKREKRGVFTYRMGVGLCKGTMHSGSVGSMETRLDYAILGDPLKTAATFEALSIQNPSFPLIVGQNVADKMASFGFSFRKIDSKGEDFNAFALEKDEDQSDKIELEKIELNKNDTEKLSDDPGIAEMKIFSLQKSSAAKEEKKNLLLSIFILFMIIVSATLGFNIVFATKSDVYKSESNLECSRLMEQLNCDDVLKSSFEALCLDFFEETRKVVDNKKDGQTLSELMKSVDEHFDALNMPMPKYYCCKYTDKYNHDLSDDNIAYKGFSEEFKEKISIIPYALSIRHLNQPDDSKKMYALTEPFWKTGYFERDECIKSVMGANTDYFNLNSSHYRRAASAKVEGEDMFLDTDKFFYDNDNSDIEGFYGYVFCAMPLDIQNNKQRLNYYKILAGSNYLLAFNNDNEWIFSNKFPENEKEFLFNNYQKINLLENKGYTLGNIYLKGDNWRVFAISRTAASYNYSIKTANYILFACAILLIGCFGFFIRKQIKIWCGSLALKLRMDIITAAILPLLTVSFVSYLYVNEDYTVRRAEKRSELQNSMDLMENRDYFFQPLCWNYIKEKSTSRELDMLVAQVEKTDSAEARKKAIKSVHNYLERYLCGNAMDKYETLDPHLLFRESFLLSKDGWGISVVANRNTKIGDDGLSDFARLFADVFRTTYFSMYQNINSKDALKGEMIVEKLSETLSSNFGNEAKARFLNFPDQPVILCVGYTTIGFLLLPYPDMSKPDYLVFVMVYFNNEKLVDFCDFKNNVVNINNHIASGSVGPEIYVHSSPQIDVGRYFYRHIRENSKALKEFLLASSWVNSSKYPVSRTIDLNGEHYLEARTGNKIADTMFVALTSDKPVQKEINENITKIIIIILLSIFLIFFIAQSIISDLLSPINSLIVGAQEAARGNYSFRTDSHRDDELGAVCDSFDKMMKGLEEKQLMNRMVSKTALNVSSNKTDSSSKRVNAFLLYVSVPGFNSILKNTPPNELFYKLRLQTATIAEIVLKAGGDIDKIMGEKLLIAFQVHDKKPEEIAKKVCEAARSIETNEKLSYRVAVGANFGQVISGFLGVGEKRDFTVIGDPVNVAARIATLAEKQPSERRLISEPVMKLSGDIIKTKEFGNVSLKGKSQLMKVYQLV